MPGDLGVAFWPQDRGRYVTGDQVRLRARARPVAGAHNEEPRR